MIDKLIIDCITREIRKENYTKEELQAEEIKHLKQQLGQCQQSITELTTLASTMLAPTK